MAGKQPAGLFANWFRPQTSSPRDKYTLEELKRLHEVLCTNSVVTDYNRSSVVEALRAIAELMCWDDQHERSFFDYFLDNNLMRHFSRFLEKPANRRGDVAKQVLQTLYILINNITNPTSIYYIFSNNHVNDIITLTFDFEDDEVLGYYINLLKTISLRVTQSTVQFFFQDDGQRCAFPLYSEAIKLVNHQDSMVRAAVRTITLKVYSVKDAAIQSFLVSKPASNYFTELSILTTEQCQLLDRKLSSLEAGTSGAAHSVEAALTHAEDLLSYANDILCTGERELSQLFLGCLWKSFMRPVVIEPLQQFARRESGGGVAPLCSLCMLERLLDIVSDVDLANRVACALLGVERGSENQGGPDAEGSCCRDGLLQALRGGHTVMAAAAVRVVWALIHSQAVDPEILDSGGLLPQQRKANKQLLDMLTAEGSPSNGRPAGGLFTETESFTTGRRRSGAWQSGVAAVTWGDVLCDVLLLDLLPCTALWIAGHVLLQLLAKPKSGAVLSSKQKEAVQQAVERARSTFAEVVQGPWTDALPLLASLEWDRAHKQLAAPSLASTAAAVQAWMQAVQARKLAAAPGPQAHTRRSARGAAIATHSLQRLVALSYVQQGLDSGTFAAALPIARCSEAAMKRQEVREGMLVAPQQPRKCTVSFSRGLEKTVLFAVHGLPEVAVPESGSPRLSEELQAAISSTSPCVLLVSELSSTSGSGAVLSVAPLVGTEAYTDATHTRWLHIHVRPNTRGMLKAVKTAKLGEAAQQLQEQLADGHWVLAFPNAAEAKAAQESVQRQAGQMKALLSHVLAPLTGQELPAP